MPAHSCRGPRCILTCFAAAIALIFIVSVAAGQELEPAQQKNQGVKKNRKVAHNFPDHAPTLASATDVLFVLLPSVTAAPLAAGQEEDAFAESISAADAQRATLLMQSIEHEYGGDQSARVGAVLLSQAGKAFVLHSLEDSERSSFVRTIQSAAERSLNSVNKPARGQEGSCSSSVDHNGQWMQAANYLRGLETVFASALRESTGARSDKPRLPTNGMAFHGNELPELGAAGTSALGWRPLNDAHRHIILLQYDAADGQTGGECPAEPTSSDSTAGERPSPSFYPSLLEAAQRLGQIVGKAAALQKEEKEIMLASSAGSDNASSELVNKATPVYRQTFLTVILKEASSSSKSDVFLQLLGDPTYNVDYNDGSGRGFCAASTLGRIQEVGLVQAASRVTGVAPLPRVGGDVGLEAQSLQAALLELGLYTRAVDCEALCRSGIAHSESSQSRGLQDLKKATYAAEACDSLFGSSANSVRDIPSLRTRLWGLVTGVPFQHGNGDFASSPDVATDAAMRQLTSVETAAACAEYNSSNTQALSEDEMSLDRQETVKETAGLQCLFGVPVLSPQAASMEGQQNGTLAARTRDIRRITCQEVLQLVQKPPLSPTEPCRLHALDIAKASFLMGHVPIVVINAPHLSKDTSEYVESQWAAMRDWQSGDDVFKQFNDLLDMGKGSSVLAEHAADVAAAASARQTAAKLGLGSDVHVEPAGALERPPAFDDGAVKSGTAKQFYNPATNAKLLGDTTQADANERRVAGSGKGNHTWHRAASSILGLDLTPGFRILNEEFDNAPVDSTAEEMWLAFDTFIEQVQRKTRTSLKAQIFFPVPDSVLPSVSPADWLFFGDKDLELARRYLWISTAGVTTHLHADHDHNIFAQIRGRKRFRLFPPENWRSMHLFPRTHPMWHKSRILDLDSPAPVAQFPDFAHAHAIEAVVAPGELLYVPPYTFHQVDTLSDDSADGALGGGVAISMTSWSHNTTLYGFLDELYGMPLVTDNIGAWEGKVYAMRALVDLLISRLHGPNRSPIYTQQLLDRVLSAPVGRHYPRNPIVERLCAARKLPMSRAVYQDARLDVKVLSHQLNIATPLAMRDLLAADFIEENIVHTLGVDSLRSFLGSCFRGQTYFLTRTEGDTAEQHARLWKFRTEEDEAGYGH